MRSISPTSDATMGDRQARILAWMQAQPAGPVPLAAIKRGIGYPWSDADVAQSLLALEARGHVARGPGRHGRSQWPGTWRLR